MEIVTAPSNRAFWYDRNPLGVNKSYGDELPEHGTTERFTYTVPANRMGIVNSIFIDSLPTAAPPADGDETLIYIYHTPYGEDADLLAFFHRTKHVAFVHETISFSPQMLIAEGDKISCTTFIEGTDVGVDLLAIVTITEFDA